MVDITTTSGHTAKHVLNKDELLRSIARDLSVSTDEIENLFTLVVQRYSHECTVHDYLPVMIPRRVKELYLKRTATRAEEFPNFVS